VALLQLVALDHRAGRRLNAIQRREEGLWVSPAGMGIE
jgi:hypothetical protein